MADWKRRALSVLPWNHAGTLAALLVLELPDEIGDDWPSHDPVQIGKAALMEATERLSRAREAARG